MSWRERPTDPEVTATVFVRTDAMPAGFADVQTPGVEWVYSDLQEAIVDELRSSHRSRTAREIADAVDCSKEHVRKTLNRLVDVDAVQAVEGLEANGATLYSDSGLPNTGVVNVQESPTDSYVDSSRWALAIRDPGDGGETDHEVTETDSGDTRPTIWPQSASDPSD